MEVTGRKDVQNGGRSILKMTTGFGLFSSLSKVKIYFFLVFTSNLSYLNSFKLQYKIQLLGFRSPLTERLSTGTIKQLNKIINGLEGGDQQTVILRLRVLCESGLIDRDVPFDD